VRNYSQGVRASVRPREGVDVLTCFKEGFQARGRGSIKFYDGKDVGAMCVDVCVELRD